MALYFITLKFDCTKILHLACRNVVSVLAACQDSFPEPLYFVRK